VSSHDDESARAEIAEALTCPVQWGKVFQLEDSADFLPLERLWQSIVESVAVDNEVEFFSPHFQLDELSASELRAMQINVRTWRDHARAEYLSRTRWLQNLRYAERADYAKHQPPPAASTTSVAELSVKDGISKFYKNIPANIMLEAFLHGLFFHFGPRDLMDLGSPIVDQAFWDALMDNTHSRVAFWSSDAIGAVEGHPTNFLCFDIDASTPIIHAYPVSEAEANRIRDNNPLIRIDHLRGWGAP
jgi:hypothetical protein